MCVEMSGGRRITACLLAIVMLWAGLGCAAQTRENKKAAKTPGAARPELVLNLGHSDLLRAFTFSPDGATLASGSGDGTIKLWGVQSGDLLRTLSAHAGWVTALAMSPDGSTVASGSTDVTTKLWDVSTGTLLHTWPSQDGNVEALAIAPDGQTIACAGSFRITLWDVPTRKEIRRLHGHDYGASALAFSPDGKVLASGGEKRVGNSHEGELKLWHVQSGTLQQTLTGFDSNGKHIAFSSDGGTLAFGAIEPVPPRGDGSDITINGVAQGRSNYIIQLWDVKTAQVRQTLRGSEFSIYSLALSADGKTLVSGDMYNMVRIWDTTGAQRHAMRVGSQINPVAISPDGETVASIGQQRNDIRLSSARTGEALRVLPGRSGGVGQIVFSADGRALAHSHSTGARDSTVRVWDIRTARLMQTREVTGYVSALCFAPDRKSLMAGIGQYDGSEKPGHQVWWGNISSGVLQRWVSLPQAVLSFSPDGKTVAAGDWRAPIQLWDVSGPSGSEAKLLPLKVERGRGTRAYAVFTPDGGKVAIGGWDSAVRIWNVKTGKLAATIQDPKNTANAVEVVAFAPRSGRWATAYSWGPISLRESLQPQVTRTFGYSSVNFLAFSPDGTTLVVGNLRDNGVTLWNVASGRSERTIKDLGGTVRAVAHTPAGLVMAVSGEDGTITLWSGATGRRLVTLLILPGNQSQSSTEWIAYTPDGYYDASPGAEKFIRWRAGNEIHPAAQYRSAFHRPGLLRKALSGKNAGM